MKASRKEKLKLLTGLQSPLRPSSLQFGLTKSRSILTNIKPRPEKEQNRRGQRKHLSQSHNVLHHATGTQTLSQDCPGHTFSMPLWSTSLGTETHKSAKTSSLIVTIRSLAYERLRFRTFVSQLQVVAPAMRLCVLPFNRDQRRGRGDRIT